ncbi:MAG TPA: DUF4386 domain-containing protein, partial [Dermatophilaceae bacterium]|nr:DUF4386 domain-containing protein [Dermatophilaceae bacterium]
STNRRHETHGVTTLDNADPLLETKLYVPRLRRVSYVLLYQSRLVPRWLSTWGLVGAALYIVPPLGSMFGLSLGVLMAPLAVQEMVLAVWLIAKGITPRAVASASAHESPLALAQVL